MSPTLDGLKLAYRQEVDRQLQNRRNHLQELILDEFRLHGGWVPDPPSCSVCGETCAYCGEQEEDRFERAHDWASGPNSTRRAVEAGTELQEVERDIHLLNLDRKLWPDRVLGGAA